MVLVYNIYIYIYIYILYTSYIYIYYIYTIYIYTPDVASGRVEGRLVLKATSNRTCWRLG